MSYAIAFVVGGLICASAQLLMDFTKLTPAHIMVIFVSLGALLSAIGLYGPLVEWAGAGASVPITNFGHLLTQGVFRAVDSQSVLGLFSGMYSLVSSGIGAAIVFGVFAAIAFNSKS